MEIMLIAIICILVVICIFLSIKRHKEELDYSDYINSLKDSAAENLKRVEDTKALVEEWSQTLANTKEEIFAAQKAESEYKDTLNKYDVSLAQLQGQIDKAKIELSSAEEKIADIDKQYAEKQSYIADIEKSADKIFEERCQKLEQEYQLKKSEKENLILTIQEQVQEVESELASIKATRDAALETKRKEEEIKANLDFYRLDISPQEQNDILLLEQIKPRFSNPRVISKLIWSEYYQKIAKVKLPKILGDNVTGIYKITNTKNDMCYIGQAVDLRKRLIDHIKHACGIDTPQNNKLYKAMMEDGIYNFTFEVVEPCEKERLNEKEAYFIKLFSSVEYGYNSRNESR